MPAAIPSENKSEEPETERRRRRWTIRCQRGLQRVRARFSETTLKRLSWRPASWLILQLQAETGMPRSYRNHSPAKYKWKQWNTTGPKYSGHVLCRCDRSLFHRYSARTSTPSESRSICSRSPYSSSDSPPSDKAQEGIAIAG